MIKLQRGNLVWHAATAAAEDFETFCLSYKTASNEHLSWSACELPCEQEALCVLFLLFRDFTHSSRCFILLVEHKESRGEVELMTQPLENIPSR